jgi:hypothetical protein
MDHVTGDLTCEELRELAPDLAASVAIPDERERAGRHLADCAACRAFVGGLAETIDLLLLLSPTEPPAVGFEARTLDRLGHARPSGAPRRLVIAAAAAAALVLALVGVVVGRATAPDVPPETVASAQLMAADDRPVGRVYVHRGSTTWIVVDVEGLLAVGPYGLGDPSAVQSYRVELVPTSGPPVSVGNLEVLGGRGIVTVQPPTDSDIHAVRLVTATGEPGCEAVFD